jgi:hypothetical protein
VVAGAAVNPSVAEEVDELEPVNPSLAEWVDEQPYPVDVHGSSGICWAENGSTTNNLLED